MRRITSTVAFLVVSLVVVLAVAVGVGVLNQAGRNRLAPTLTGPCHVRAVIEPGATVVDPSVSAGVYRLPIAGSVQYEANLANLANADTTPTRRLIGHVRLDLPAPLPDPVLAAWDEPGSLRTAQGVHAYQMATRWAPIGATVRILAQHVEPTMTCGGSLTVRIDGNAASSFLRPTAISVVVAAATLVGRAARPRSRDANPWVPPRAARPPRRRHGRPGLGGAAGLLYGSAAAVVMVLSGATDLASTTLWLWPIGGMAAGVILGWWAPSSGPTGPTGAHQDAPPVVLSEPDHRL